MKAQHYFQCYVVDVWVCVLFENVTFIVLASISMGDMVLGLGLAAREAVWYYASQDVEIAM